MAVYKYQPLDLEAPSLRLLKLLKGDFGDDIQCELIIGSIEHGIPYDALSYTWGTTEKVATITVDGGIMGVTTNVYEALQQIRSSYESRYLWIDAICINQDNLRERGHQVQQMSVIYQKAERVVIWLGQGIEETDLVMDSMKQIHNILVGKEGDWRQLARFWMEGWPTGCHVGMKSLLSRRWFQRIWIIQEVANARVAIVLCGKKSISASTFAQVPRLLGLQPDPHCQAVLDIMPGVSRQTSWWKDKRDLHTLLRKFRESEATDPRDIIYALLGISSDACTENALLPDYEKPLSQVIQDTASFLLFHTHLDDSLYKFPNWTLPEFLQNLESLGSAVLNDALVNGHKKFVELLLHATDGVESESKASFYQSPLSQAAENGHEDIVKQLLAFEEINVEFKDSYDQSPLSLAAQNGHEAIVMLLLTRSEVEINSRDINHRTPLLWAARKGHEAVIKLLLATGEVEVDSKDKGLRTPLSWAASNGHKAIVKLLLATGQVEVNSEDKAHLTPLSWAASNGYKAVVELLLITGKARVDTRDMGLRTPLSWAARGGHEAVVKLLLATGVEVNSEDEDRMTPLLWAARRGHEAVVKLLLATGQVDINSEDENRQTPLSWATTYRHEAVIKLLREHVT